MASGNTKFTKRLTKAIEILSDDSSMGLVRCRTGSLYSPCPLDGVYRWIKLMDSDGLLVVSREVRVGEGAEPEEPVDLLVGIIIQSEYSTSQTKPNPIGKAALSHASLGVWVDVKGESRRRLDHAHVLFVLPSGTSGTRKKRFRTAKTNVANAAALMPQVDVLVLGHGLGAEGVAKKLSSKVTRLLRS